MFVLFLLVFIFFILNLRTSYIRYEITNSAVTIDPGQPASVFFLGFILFQNQTIIMRGGGGGGGSSKHD